VSFEYLGRYRPKCGENSSETSSDQQISQKFVVTFILLF
jgi:hypothetical protein